MERRSHDHQLCATLLLRSFDTLLHLMHLLYLRYSAQHHPIFTGISVRLALEGFCYKTTDTIYLRTFVFYFGFIRSLIL